MTYKKLEPFDHKQSNWVGLWYHPESGGYSSACISLADLRKFKGNVRVYMRKNKFYERGSNRPNYCFCIKDAHSSTFAEIGVEDDTAERLYTEEELQDAIRKATEDMYTYSDLERVMNGAVEDGRRGYGVGDVIVEDYI